MFPSVLQVLLTGVVLLLLAPQLDFFDQLNNNVPLFLVLGIVIFLIPTLASLYIAWSVIKPLRQLVTASQSLAGGRWQRPLSEPMAIAEIQQLAKAINAMALRLQQTLEQDREDFQGSKELYQRVVQNQTDFILRSQPDTTITFANDALCQALGLSLAEVIGLQWLDFISEDDLNIVLEKIACLTPEEPQFINENQDQRAGGVVGYTQWINRGIFNDNGQLIEIQSVGRDISTLKETQLALKQSQKFIESIAEATPSLLYIYDHVKQSNAYSNRSVGEFLGYSPEEIRAMGASLFANICHPEDLPRILAAIENCQKLRDGEILEIEYRVRDARQRWRWLLSRDLVFTRTETGELWQTLGTAQDITQRKEAEIELQKIKTFLASIVENIPDMVFVKDAENLRFLELNKAGENLIGYTKEEVLGKSDHDLFPQEQAEWFIQEDQKVLLSGKVKDIPREFIQTSHGGVRVLHTKKIPIADEVGRAKYLLGISDDITELLESEQRLQELARHIPGVIYQFRMRPDGTFHFPYASEGIRDIYGVTPEEVRDNSDAILAVLHPDELDGLFQSIYTSAANLTPWYYEYRVYFPEGRVIWVLGYATPQRESDGGTIWHGYIKDITEQKAKEYLLITEKERAENAEKILKKAQTRLERFNKKLSYLVDIDGLTKISNRRCFNVRIKQEWGRLSRSQQPLSLILFDIDYFKNYNDYYGHPQGDNCLIRVARGVRRSVSRPADLLARFGGEEFAIILPETDGEGALLVMQKVVNAIAQLAIAHEASPIGGQITISLGISTQFPSKENSPRTLIEQADRALYEAKRRGRNQYVVWTEELEGESSLS
ncbi:PAS domain S-box protein [Synechocystis salina LEGE 00031]|uniref:PAS domain S-box protein n=1 Tax=Synechocystis salina LEGE 00031 TaxID=1828736 RepID=A0ABR9VUK4_9SYNC|nr:PAS domain S-box protein [Synechocystis salina LEGE 00041]MBE9254138.1 PAS domain S-box protein [Synechocystis salina LEGE 00031]